MVGKKAYMRTLEVMLALVLTFAFVLYIMPSPNNTSNEIKESVLINLIDDVEFRREALNISSCVYNGGNVTISNILDEKLKLYSNYAICPDTSSPTLPRREVNAEALYLTGNITDFNTGTVVRLYYWE